MGKFRLNNYAYDLCCKKPLPKQRPVKSILSASNSPPGNSKEASPSASQKVCSKRNSKDVLSTRKKRFIHKKSRKKLIPPSQCQSKESRVSSKIKAARDAWCNLSDLKKWQIKSTVLHKTGHGTCEKHADDFSRKLKSCGNHSTKKRCTLNQKTITSKKRMSPKQLNNIENKICLLLLKKILHIAHENSKKAKSSVSSAGKLMANTVADSKVHHKSAKKLMSNAIPTSKVHHDSAGKLMSNAITASKVHHDSAE
ncbi:uncharacterized protein LOC119689502 [Teleopsis dalmanni]|uniref:uncharacterized protein LOC119689502 n=1 Tax=Teleopsis dalmanni TaxID=139649 RepID=UPI0018CEFFE9|nr:uncharacterized protein LOC119689502 [Teleopsis dalmanni]